MKKFPLTALLTVVAVFIVSGLFIRFTEPLTGIPVFQPISNHAMVVAKRTMMTDVQDNLVIVGDSSSLHGLRPSVISEIVGVPTTNLGTLSSMTTIGFSELAAATMESYRPKAIIYSILPQSLEVTVEKARELGVVGKYLIAYGNSLGLHTVSIRDKIDWFVAKHRFNVFPSRFEGSYNAFFDVIKERQGYLEEKPKELVIKTPLSDFKPASYSVEPLIAISELANNSGVPLFFSFNPKPEGAVSEQYVEQVNAFLAGLVESNPGMKFLSPTFEAQDPAKFGTETHLLLEPAADHSRVIAAEISQALQEWNINNTK